MPSSALVVHVANSTTSETSRREDKRRLHHSRAEVKRRLKADPAFRELSAPKRRFALDMVGKWWNPERGAYPGMKKLMRHYDVSERTIRYWRSAIVEAGLFIRIPCVRANGSQAGSVYLVHLRFLEGLKEAVETALEKERTGLAFAPLELQGVQPESDSLHPPLHPPLHPLNQRTLNQRTSNQWLADGNLGEAQGREGGTFVGDEGQVPTTLPDTTIASDTGTPPVTVDEIEELFETKISAQALVNESLLASANGVLHIARETVASGGGVGLFIDRLKAGEHLNHQEACPSCGQPSSDLYDYGPLADCSWPVVLCDECAKRASPGSSPSFYEIRKALEVSAVV